MLRRRHQRVRDQGQAPEAAIREVEGATLQACYKACRADARCSHMAFNCKQSKCRL